MRHYIPYAKLSKKKQRELNAARRGTWGALCPVTRKPPNPKAYNRQKTRRSRDDDRGVFFLSCRSVPVPESAQARRSVPAHLQTL